MQRFTALGLSIPAYNRQVHANQVYMIANLTNMAVQCRQRLCLNVADSSSLDWSRNILLHGAIKQGCDWCLMCDADNYFYNPQLIYQMIEEGIQRQAAVIAAPVKMRGREGWNAGNRDENGLTKFFSPDEFKDKVVPCDRIGTAFMAVKCGWIVKNFPQPWFETKQIPGDPPSKIGEDYNFCDQIKAKGGLILCDGRVIPEHAGATSETAQFIDMGGQLYGSTTEHNLQLNRPNAADVSAAMV